MTLSAALVVLSAAGRLQQLNYSIPGHCPEPPPSSELFDGPRLSVSYAAAMRYDSEAPVDLQTQDLNCMHLYFPERDARLHLTDCGNYEGLLQNHAQQYRMVLRQIDFFEPCFNRTHAPILLSLWTDRRKELLLIWSCTQNQHQTTHKQVATVFISLNYTLYIQSGRALVQKVRSFAEDKLSFSGLPVVAFEVNRRLLEEGKMDTECDYRNCTIDCPLEAPGHFRRSLLYFVVICAVTTLLLLLLV